MSRETYLNCTKMVKQARHKERAHLATNVSIRNVCHINGKCKYLKTKMILVSATYFQSAGRSFPLKSFWMILDSHNILNSITLVSAKNCRVLWPYKWVSMNLFPSIFINQNNFRENFKNIYLIKCPYFNSTVIIGDNVTVACRMIKAQRRPTIVRFYLYF